MTFTRVDPRAGFVGRSAPRGPNGRMLCRECGVETEGKRTTFCSSACVHAWKIRTQPGYVRGLVFQRDKGVCAACGLDTVALKAAIEAALPPRPSSPWEEDRDGIERPASEWMERRSAWEKAHAAWNMACYTEKRRIADLYRALGFHPGVSPWQADHIVPVVEGGGGCGLENYRTLCVPCHRRVTRELRGRMAARRRPARDS